MDAASLVRVMDANHADDFLPFVRDSYQLLTATAMAEGFRREHTAVPGSIFASNSVGICTWHCCLASDCF